MKQPWPNIPNAIKVWVARLSFVSLCLVSGCESEGSARQHSASGMASDPTFVVVSRPIEDGYRFYAFERPTSEYVTLLSTEEVFVVAMQRLQQELREEPDFRWLEELQLKFITSANMSIRAKLTPDGVPTIEISTAAMSAVEQSLQLYRSYPPDHLGLMFYADSERDFRSGKQRWFNLPLLYLADQTLAPSKSELSAPMEEAAIAILAHEACHHKLGHTERAFLEELTALNPEDRRLERQSMERWADHCAGNVLAKLKIDALLPMMDALILDLLQAPLTISSHPSAAERLTHAQSWSQRPFSYTELLTTADSRRAFSAIETADAVGSSAVEWFGPICPLGKNKLGECAATRDYILPDHCKDLDTRPVTTIRGYLLDSGDLSEFFPLQGGRPWAVENFWESVPEWFQNKRETGGSQTYFVRIEGIVSEVGAQGPSLSHSRLLRPIFTPELEAVSGHHVETAIRSAQACGMRPALPID